MVIEGLIDGATSDGAAEARSDWNPDVCLEPGEPPHQGGAFA
jgi:hypothetical protein